MLRKPLSAPLAAALALVVSGSAHAAAENVCLRSNRIYSWEVLDDKTLLVTDLSRTRYRVSVVGTCIGLDNTKFALAFETFTEMSCLKVGDHLRFYDPVFGPQRCPISSVEAYVAPDDKE
jgi:hypothetical protein